MIASEQHQDRPFVINLFSRGDGGDWWLYWPAAIWGIGLALHALSTFIPVFSPEWANRRAARMVKEEDRYT